MKNNLSLVYTDFEKCSKFSYKNRKKLLSSFEDFTLDKKNECIKKQYQIYIKLRNYYDVNVAMLCAFYKAISQTDSVKKTNSEFNFNFEQKVLINFFKKQDLLVQIEIFKEQKNQYFKNKHIVENSYLSLFAFFKSIDIFYIKFKKKFYKNKTYDLKSQSSIVEINILKDKKQKQSIKKERFLNYVSVVKKLKNEGYSYRKMSKHFATYYKYDVSHTYLKQMIDKFMQEEIDEL